MDKETERAKVEVIASFYTGAHVNALLTYLSILVAVIVGLYAAFVANQIGWIPFVIGTLLWEGVIVYVIAGKGKRFKKRVKYLDTLFAKLDNNQPVGTLEAILDNAPK